MTSHRQRLQPDHHIESYDYPTGVFDDAFCPAANDFFASGASSSNIEGAHCHNPILGPSPKLPINNNKIK